MNGVEFSELKIQLDRIEGLVARLIDLQLGLTPGDQAVLTMGELADEISRGNHEALRRHNRQQSKEGG